MHAFRAAIESGEFDTIEIIFTENVVLDSYGQLVSPNPNKLANPRHTLDRKQCAGHRGEQL
jgi:hypothetical protein